jgi:hypothetical protein
MDSNKLEAALRRLEDEQFGRTFNVPGIDAAVLGGWMRWMRDTPGIDLERMRAFALLSKNRAAQVSRSSGVRTQESTEG